MYHRQGRVIHPLSAATDCLSSLSRGGPSKISAIHVGMSPVSLCRLVLGNHIVEMS